RVRIGIVDALSLSVELIGKDVVVKDGARSGERSIAMRRGVIATVGAELNFGGTRAASRRPKLHDAGHGIRPVYRTFGATFRLEAVDVVHRNHAEIEEASGVVYRHAVHQHLVVVGFS